MAKKDLEKNSAADRIQALVSKIADPDFEVGRASKRSLWKIVRHAGRPGAEKDKVSVIRELLPLLDSEKPLAVCREVMWLISDIGGDESVDSVAAFLGEKDLREDARMVLDHIPGKRSLEALKTALKTVPDDFKINIAQSLRHRGVEVSGFPCRKLVPTKQTNVKPLK